jgi:hypothetical protein
VTCEDKQEYFIDSDTEKTCDWIAESEERRQQYCVDIDTRDSCPVTCGYCCKDSGPSFKFTANNGKERGCIWLAEKEVRINKYCPRSWVKSGCRKTCDFCAGSVPTSTPTELPSKAPSYAPSDLPSGIPSLSPSILPTNSPTISMKPSSHPTQIPSAYPSVSPSTNSPTITCVDDSDFRQNDNTERTCDWIGEETHRLNFHCVNSDVITACPATCGVCCVDDSLFKFDRKREDDEKLVGCKWLAENQDRIDRYCWMDDISHGCMKTCDQCPEDYSIPVLIDA